MAETMSNHQVLNPADHGGLRLRTGAGPELGDGVAACLVVPQEFRRLACEYPILFRYDAEARAFSAQALLGFEPGENLFLEGGRWDATCRPLAMAVQPFLIGRGRDGDGPAQVHVDMDHPRIATDSDGVPVFDEAGQPTAVLEEAAAMLGALDEGFRASGDFFAAADRYGLLEPFSMDVTLDSGAVHRLVGYHLVDEDKLAALEPAVLAELHAAGHLEPLFMALASLGNLAKLVRRKGRRGHG
jgi:hypothetical protein